MKLLFCLYFSLISVFALTKDSENKKSAWLGTFSKKEITDDLSYWMETQVRYNFDLGGTNQILYRTGLLHSNGIGALYGYIQSSKLKEHRLTLQHTAKYTSVFSHRARFEFRLMEDSFENSERFRYLLRGSFSNDLVAWNEAFFNLSKTNWNGERFFERNRLFLGIRKNFENISFEVGYLNQYVPRKNKDIYEHIAVIYVFI